ncbi:hypothetical protein OIU76_025507 [Salix suchowensis]|nr:hypothetical protein OIU76_025507 [Salix suchowensis]
MLPPVAIPTRKVFMFLWHQHFQQVYKDTFKLKKKLWNAGVNNAPAVPVMSNIWR